MDGFEYCRTLLLDIHRESKHGYLNELYPPPPIALNKRRINRDAETELTDILRTSTPEKWTPISDAVVLFDKERQINLNVFEFFGSRSHSEPEAHALQSFLSKRTEPIRGITFAHQECSAEDQKYYLARGWKAVVKGSPDAMVKYISAIYGDDAGAKAREITSIWKREMKTADAGTDALAHLLANGFGKKVDVDFVAYERTQREFDTAYIHLAKPIFLTADSTLSKEESVALAQRLVGQKVSDALRVSVEAVECRTRDIAGSQGKECHNFALRGEDNFKKLFAMIVDAVNLKPEEASGRRVSKPSTGKDLTA